MRTLFVLLVLFAGISCLAKTDHDGVYSIRNAEIRYTIPARFVGMQLFTQIETVYQDDRHMGIFNTSYASGVNGKPAAGLSLGMAHSPSETRWDDFDSYVKYYASLSDRLGLSAKTDIATFAGRRWLHVQQFYANGSLARVIYVTRVFDDMNLVLRIGMPDNMHPEFRDSSEPQWEEEAGVVLRSIVIK